MPFDEEELDPHGECAAEIVRLTTIIARARLALSKDSLSMAERIADADRLLTAVHQQQTGEKT